LDENADPTVWHARGSRQILRLSLHLGRAQSEGQRPPKGLLATLNLGQALIDFQRQGMPDPVKAAVNSVLLREVTPLHGSRTIRDLMETDLDVQRRPLAQRVATMLEQASDLLTFGLLKGA